MLNYIAQGIGFIGMILVFVAFQNNNKKKILLFQAGAGAVFTVHFILLGAYTGAAMNAVEIARNLVFCRDEKMKRKAFWIFPFIGIFTIMGALTWQNMFSILPIISMNLSTYVFSLQSPRHIRMFFLPVASCWLVYNIVTFSIAGILTEVFDIVSLLIAIWRFDIADMVLKKQGAEGGDRESG